MAPVTGTLGGTLGGVLGPVTGTLGGGISRPARLAQANIRIASSTTEVTGPGAVSVAAVFVTAARPATGYVVQPGDTLSGIAARRGGVRGGCAACRPCTRLTAGSSALIRA